MKQMGKWFSGILIVLWLVAPLRAELVEEIVFSGNKKVSLETIKFYVKSKSGETFSETKVREDFKALWETGFFADIRVEADEGKAGKIIRFIFQENPLISSVTYKTGKKLKQEDIIQKLQDNNIVILSFSYFNPAKVGKIEGIIKAMLQEKGYSSGKVTVEKKEENEQVALTITVGAGPKTRIGHVEFPGLDTKRVSSGFLRRGMKNNRLHGLLSSIASKDVLKLDKMEEDLEGLRERFYQKGYLEAKIGTPSYQIVNRMSVWGKAQPMMKISIPVDMGPQYRLHEVTITGNKVLKTKDLRAFVKLKEGKVYNAKKRNKMVEEMQKVYGMLGYFYCQIVPQENLDPVKKLADLIVNIQENEIVYLGKLEFTGNTFTKDHVLRREWLLREGRRLNSLALEDSLRRMRQLGLVTINKMPEIKPDPTDPLKLNITAEVQEVNRQMVQFNVGYSGYDGWFVGIGYQTQNFMGLGETLNLNLQYGSRAKNYQIAFTEPYLLNQSASLGADVFKTSFSYPSLYTRNSKGFSLSTSARFWKYWGSSLSYGYEFIEISDVDEDYLAYLSTISYYAALFAEGKRGLSSISPTIYYTTVDSPIFPSSGVKYLFTYRYSGGPLGGDIDMHKFHLEWVKFLPVWKRHTLGLHVDFQFAKPFSGQAIPYYEYYYLGGERSIRGFDIYELGPKNKDGLVIGGDKALFMNVEYQIPFSPQFSLVFFGDAGNAYAVGRGINLRDIYSSFGAEFKIFVPMLNVPFRLIFSYNPRLIDPDDEHFVFRFAVGPSFY